MKLHFIESSSVSRGMSEPNDRLTIAFSSSTDMHEERGTERYAPACMLSQQNLRIIVLSGRKLAAFDGTRIRTAACLRDGRLLY
ncbi:hypothetical protein WN55_10585 [Dufourea novaeangliae]|uniref:Uncharacterized protein n=1 Tax=Dufourea novaeangliae TaxID=178035 RepID=A0A154P5Q5_DUFNO|nr:hypothetical protein WN55_10585 [Dufourea novaeangliae]